MPNILGRYTNDVEIDISEFGNVSENQFVVVSESASGSHTVLNHSALTDAPRELTYTYTAAKIKIVENSLQVTAPTIYGNILWWPGTKKIPYSIYFLG